MIIIFCNHLTIHYYVNRTNTYCTTMFDKKCLEPLDLSIFTPVPRADGGASALLRKCWDDLSLRREVQRRRSSGQWPIDDSSMTHRLESSRKQSNRLAPLRRFHQPKMRSLVCAEPETATIGCADRSFQILRKGDSLKVGQDAPLSSRMIGQPLLHQRKASLLSPAI